MKIPKARQLSSGRWFIQLRLDGESISVTEDTREQCEARAMTIKSGLARRERRGAELTLGRAMDRYIAKYEPVRSPSTIAGYKSIRRTRFQRWMDVPAEGLDWQRIVNAEMSNCSEKTLKNAFSLARAALGECGVTIHAKLPTVVPNEHAWLQPDEVIDFIRALDGLSFELPALLALHGLRRSEVFALTWDDIDLAKGLISVDGALVIDDDGNKIRRRQTKTRTSRRKVPILAPELRAALEHVEDKTGVVCAGHPNSLYKQINTLCDSLGLPRVGVHGLRHSFASLCYHLGLSELETMELGGWSDYATMRKIYTHLSAEDRRSGAQKITEFFKNR